MTCKVKSSGVIRTVFEPEEDAEAVLAMKSVSPLYTGTITWAPTRSPAVLEVATPLERTADPTVFPLSRNLMVPVGTPLVVEAIVAVIVTFRPNAIEGVLRVVVMTTGAFVTVRVPLFTTTT
jgi:hypothetical protein